MTIPESVTVIGNDAFWECSSLASVTILAGVTTIGSNAFCDCGTLASVNIPKSVTEIGADAFSGCFELTDVWYAGTAEEWALVRVDLGNEPLSDALHCHEHLCSGNAALVWIWAEDGMSASASFTCTECGESAAVAAVIESSTTEPTCTMDGEICNTASVIIGGLPYIDEQTCRSRPPATTGASRSGIGRRTS